MTIYISAIMACSSNAPHGPANMSSGNLDSEVDVNHVMESLINEVISPRVGDMQPLATEVCALCSVPCLNNIRDNRGII